MSEPSGDLNSAEEGWSRYLSFAQDLRPDEKHHETYRNFLAAVVPRLAQFKPTEKEKEHCSYVRLLRHQAEDEQQNPRGSVGWIRCDGEQWKRTVSGEFALLGLEFLGAAADEHLPSLDFVVFHIGVRCASSSLMEDVTKSLHRPRSKFKTCILSDSRVAEVVRVEGNQTTGERSAHYWSGTYFKPLYEFLQVFKALVHVPQTCPQLQMTKGGYLEFDNKSSEDAQFPHTSKPHRSVVALPGTMDIP